MLCQGWEGLSEVLCSVLLWDSIQPANLGLSVLCAAVFVLPRPRTEPRRARAASPPCSGPRRWDTRPPRSPGWDPGAAPAPAPLHPREPCWCRYCCLAGRSGCGGHPTLTESNSQKQNSLLAQMAEACANQLPHSVVPPLLLSSMCNCT